MPTVGLADVDCICGDHPGELRASWSDGASPWLTGKERLLNIQRTCFKNPACRTLSVLSGEFV